LPLAAPVSARAGPEPFVSTTRDAAFATSLTRLAGAGELLAGPDPSPFAG